MRFFKQHQAFTMIELLIVVAIIAIVAAFVIPSFLGGSHQGDLNAATESIVASARDAQSKATDDVQSTSWGIHFSNATNTAPFYAVFSGSSYASGTVSGVYRLPATIGFISSTVPVGESFDVIFSPVSGAAALSGTVNASTAVALYVLSQPSLSSTITIDPAGAISIGGTFSSLPSQFGTYFSQLGCSSGACSSGSSDGEFVLVGSGVAVDSGGNVYVSDTEGNRVEEFNASGTYVTQFGCPSGACSSGSSDGALNSPAGVAVDSGGNVWVADSENNRVEEFNPSGTYMNQLGCSSGACSSGSSDGAFGGGGGIDGVAVDSGGNVYVVDNYNYRVEKFSSSGTYVTQFGCPSGACSSGSSDGAFGPEMDGVAVDSGGNVWVADSENNRVEEFNPSGTYMNQLGCPSGFCSARSSDGQFDDPMGVAVDSSGNVYVGDNGNYRVEEFNASRTYVSQLGCSSGACSSGSSDGQFGGGFDIAIGSSGNIYVTDSGDNRVEEFTLNN